MSRVELSNLMVAQYPMMIAMIAAAGMRKRLRKSAKSISLMVGMMTTVPM